MDAKALRNILADKLLKIKADTLAKTLIHVGSYSLLHTLAHTLAELQVENSADKLCDLKALELVDVLGKMLVGKKKTDTPRIPERCGIQGISQDAGLQGSRTKGLES